MWLFFLSLICWSLMLRLRWLLLMMRQLLLIYQPESSKNNYRLLCACGCASCIFSNSVTTDKRNSFSARVHEWWNQEEYNTHERSFFVRFYLHQPCDLNRKFADRKKMNLQQRSSRKKMNYAHSGVVNCEHQREQLAFILSGARAPAERRWACVACTNG